MKKHPARVPFLALVVALFLLVTLGSTPSGFSTAVRRQLPNLDETALFRQLVNALSPVSPESREFHLVQEVDLASALRNEQQRFALFDKARKQASSETLAAMPYGEVIDRMGKRFGVEGFLLAAVVEVESNFDARAISPRGAVGLAQVMPQADGELSAEDLKNPETNLAAGAWYLKYLLDQYDGDLELTLAAYNAGPGNVSRYNGVPPFEETRAFVRKVLEIYESHHEEAAQQATRQTELGAAPFPARPPAPPASLPSAASVAAR